MNSAISRPTTGRTTDEPTDPRQVLQTEDWQHAQEQIQQKQNINLFRPQWGSVPIRFSMDALTATEPVVFVLDIKTIPALFHLIYRPRQKSSAETNLISQECMEFLDFLRVAG